MKTIFKFVLAIILLPLFSFSANTGIDNTDQGFGKAVPEFSFIPAGVTKLTDKPELVSINEKAKDWTPQVKFQIPGMINGKEQMITLVDYASAGSTEVGKDVFRLWIPTF